MDGHYLIAGLIFLEAILKKDAICSQINKIVCSVKRFGIIVAESSKICFILFNSGVPDNQAVLNQKNSPNIQDCKFSPEADPICSAAEDDGMFFRLIITIFALMVFPAYAFAINLTDYTIADSKSSDVYLNGSFNFTDGNQEQASYDGLVSTVFNAQYSSVPMVWTLDSSGRYEFERGAAMDDEMEDGYQLQAKTTIDRYYRDTRFLGFGSLTGGYRKTIGADESDDPYFHIGVGMGFGRLYDATVLGKAMRIVDDLIKYNVISSKLSDYGYIKLAQVIDREGEFESTYGLQEYKKYWYEAMEEVFVDEGVLSTDTLGALGLIRIEEILEQEHFSTRTHGWILRVGTGHELSNYDGSDTDPTVFATFEFGIPYTYRLQFSNLTEVMTIWNHNPDYTITNTAALSYEISNQIDWENTWALTLMIPTADDLDTLMNNTLTSGFRYYLTSSVSANLDLSLNHFEDQIDDNGNDEIEKKVFAGITYRIR